MTEHTTATEPETRTHPAASEPAGDPPPVDPIPLALTLFRAWSTPPAPDVDPALSTFVRLTAGMLDAHRRHRDALRQFLYPANESGEHHGIEVVTDALHAAHRDLEVLARAIDDHVAEILPATGSHVVACHRTGLGEEVSRLCRCWIAVTDPIPASPVDSEARQSLGGQAVLYNQLADNLNTGLARLPHRPSTDPAAAPMPSTSSTPSPR
ncbi:hypothetical protein [Nocardia takedensis]|uniref:hypothetical protein n=1 Tax=Nocardia takedensis TaxID=259390 RepID=UPI0002F4C671|nr:hypothetical protein [Nocardia takedensis]